MTWQTRPVGEVFDVVGGGTPSKKNPKYYGGDIPWATIRDMHSSELSETEHTITQEGLRTSSSKVIPSGEVIMASRVGLGKACLLQQDTAINQDIRALVPRKSKTIDRRFCLYWLQRMADTIIGAGSGATVQGVKLPFIKSLPFPDIDVEEQKRIVAVLDQAFAALDRARANAEANLADAEELFEAQQLLIFSSIDAEPKTCLGNLCEFVRGPFGGSLKKSIFKPSGYAVYEQQHAIRDQFSDFRYFVDEAKFSEMNRFRVQSGDLIMSCSGTMGKVAIVPDEAPEGIINQALLKLRPKAELRGDFLKRWMQSDDFQDQLSENTMGVAIKNVASVKTLKTLSVALPDLDEQELIVDRIEEAEQLTDRVMQAYEATLQDIDKLRQSILQNAFAGELT